MLMKKWKKEVIMKTKLIPKHQNPSGSLKTDKLTTETTFKDGLKRTSFIIRTPWIK